MIPHKRSKLKGPRFPSMVDPPAKKWFKRPEPQRTIPEGKQWIGTASGKGSRLRRLRQLCKTTLETKDPELIIALDKLREFCKDKNEPELLFLIGVSHALKSYDDTGLPMNFCIDYLIEKFEGQEKDKKDVAQSEDQTAKISSPSMDGKIPNP